MSESSLSGHDNIAGNTNEWHEGLIEGTSEAKGRAMGEDAYDNTLRLIEASPSIVDFANFGCGIAPDCIANAEIEIGSPFPNSYKWWLLNYSGGEIGGEEIFSVYPRDTVAILSGDIVHQYKLALRNGGDRMLIPLCHSDVDGVFSFVIQKGLQGHEYHIQSEATRDRYAEDFLDFLRKRIVAFG